MNHVEASVRDEKMLHLLDLELLSQETAGHGEALATQVGRHNDRLVALTERFNRIVGDRQRLVDFGVWADGEAGHVLTARCCLVCEHWDWLLELRGELARREAILVKAETALEAMLRDLTTRREQTVAKLNKSMAKTRREYVEANPARGEHHFAELVDSDDLVVALDQEYARRKADLEWVIDHRRQANRGRSTIMARQEEVFKLLLN